MIVAPWRIVYSLRAKAVHVVAVLDLRRGAAEILRQRATRIADAPED